MDLIDELVKDEHLKTPRIISAFRRIKRVDFLLDETRHRFEENLPLSIGHEQTISQPLTVAFMLELLQVQLGDKVLDIGSGSGWTSALLAELTGKKGKVVAIERIEELKNFGEKNTEKYGFVSSGRIKFLVGNGREGLPQDAPFDRILISAVASEIPPQLLDQLKIGGVMVAPIGEWFGAQDIVNIEKQGEHKFAEKRFPGFVFVPLVKW